MTLVLRLYLQSIIHISICLVWSFKREFFDVTAPEVYTSQEKLTSLAFFTCDDLARDDSCGLVILLSSKASRATHSLEPLNPTIICAE